MSNESERLESSGTLTKSEATMLSASIVWAVGILGYLVYQMFGSDAGSSFDLAWVVFAILPTAFVWLALRGAMKARALEDEIDDLTARMVSLREHVDELEESIQLQSDSSGLVDKVNQLAEAQEKTDSTLAVFMSSRSHAAVSYTPEPALPEFRTSQTTLLPSAMVDPQAPLSHEDFIRAANFPRNAEDRVGFAVLKLALENDKTGPFIRSAQDILTLLSQEGIYMDDLAPEKTLAESWRLFGTGKRGKDIAPLGAIRDRKLLEKVSGRMREDTVFRDTVHHFLRKFDLVFTEFSEEATDDDLVQFSETRSGRAFMLLGRIAGTFD